MTHPEYVAIENRLRETGLAFFASPTAPNAWKYTEAAIAARNAGQITAQECSALIDRVSRTMRGPDKEEKTAHLAARLREYLQGYMTTSGLTPRDIATVLHTASDHYFAEARKAEEAIAHLKTDTTVLANPPADTSGGNFKGYPPRTPLITQDGTKIETPEEINKRIDNEVHAELNEMRRVRGLPGRYPVRSNPGKKG